MENSNKASPKRSLPDWAALVLTVAAVVFSAVGTNAALKGVYITALAQPEQVPDADGGTADGAVLPSYDEEPAETSAPETKAPDTLPTEPTEPPTQPPADTVPPVIEGAADKSVVIGDTVSYREGVTVSDDSGGQVELEIDSSKVDLLTPGSYPLTYIARDESGNETTVTVTVTVTEPPEPTSGSGSGSSSTSSKTKKPWEATEEDVNALAKSILDKILKDGMSRRDQAYAIFKYVHNNISYVGTSTKSSWIAGAYEGFTSKRGDCYTYFACSKVLLTLAGIPNVDLERVGGTTRHYWQLVDVGDGYKHFDACPHSHTNVVTFLLTETEARAFTESIAWYRPNYYVYDYASCPVPVVGLDESERRPQSTEPEEPEEPEEPDTPDASEPEETDPSPEPESTDPPADDTAEN